MSEEVSIEFETFGDNTTAIKILPKIFGWNIYRVFRDADKNILKIILEKDGIYKEFSQV